MGLKACLLVLLAAPVLSLVTNLTGTLNALLPSQQYSFNLPSGYLVLSLQFAVTNTAYSNTLLYVSFNSTVPALTLPLLASYLASSNALLNYMDPISAIGGDTQIINLFIPSGATSYFVTLFNFDLPEVSSNKNFYLASSVSNTIKICMPCPSGTAILPSSNALSCQCSPCPSGFVGKACQYYLKSLSRGKNTITVSSSENQYFRIGAGSDFSFSVQEASSTGGVYLYLQYEYTGGQLAGKLNSYYLNLTTPLSYALTSSPLALSPPAAGPALLLTLRNYASSLATVTINYGEAPSTALLPIVLGTVIGVVGLVLIVVGAWQLRRRCGRGEMGGLSGNAVLNANEAVMKDEASLTDNEVNKYFPEVSAAEVFSGGEGLNSSEISLGGDELSVECSICFDSVKRSETIRVTYCRHVFHAKCLAEWFRKNQICPNCRQAYDYDSTKHFRAQLSKSAKSSPLRLVRTLLANYMQEVSLRPQASLQKLQGKEGLREQGEGEREERVTNMAE